MSICCAFVQSFMNNGEMEGVLTAHLISSYPKYLPVIFVVGTRSKLHTPGKVKENEGP